MFECRKADHYQIAIQRFFDGEPASDPVQDALAADPPQDTRRSETLMNGFSSPRSPRQSNLEPAPRIVPQPESQALTRRPPFLLSVLFTPINIIYAILTRVFRFLTWAFPPLSRLLNRFNSPSPRAQRRPLRPKDNASRFIREFSEEYGPNHLPFLETGYAQALDTAKRDLKFLLVILLSPEHDDTSSFVRQTLLDPSVKSYLSQEGSGDDSRVLLWAGSVRDSEAYQVSAAFNATKFPFSALICSTQTSGSSTSTGMSLVSRLSGPMPASQYLSKLQRAVEQYSPSLESARRKKAEMESARNLREQQNSAYERSLAADRERARQKREAEERRVVEEKAALAAAEAASRYEENLRRWRRWRASRIAPEPADGKDAVRISLRMPDGERIVRRFDISMGVEEVYAFVECYGVEGDGHGKEPHGFKHEYGFRLVSPMPREVFDVADRATIGGRLGRSANLIVERLDGGDEDYES